jgi:hypothetical protein
MLQINPNGWSSFFGKVRGKYGRVESVRPLVSARLEDTETFAMIPTNERK